MENYEQKYKEALERASHIKDNNTVATPQEVAEFLFPELKETEDGKIRKEIIEYITRYKDCITDKEYDSWIAWLEKQGEKKPVISDNALREGIAHFGITQYQIDNWLKKYVDVEKQGEQKSAWSQEDETNMDAVWRACGQAYGTDYQGILGDWLKLLKERVQLQPKQEWSEEDELVLKQLIYVCHQNGWTTVEEWLESLKPNHWKPSEEQMRVLQIAIKDYGICHEKYVLESLYNNLKNL